MSDLLGDTTAPANRFPPEEQSLGFDNDTMVLRVPTLLAESYVTAAQDLTERALADVVKLTGCDPAVLGGNAASEQACAAKFISSFGQRAFRRPLLSDEQARMLSVFGTARAELDFKGAIGTVIETILLAPQFMYRVEFGKSVANQPGIETIDSWGMASRAVLFSVGFDAGFRIVRGGASGRRYKPASKCGLRPSVCSTIRVRAASCGTFTTIGSTY